MTNDALNTFSETLRAAWGPLSSELVDTARGAMSKLLASSLPEPWLASLHTDGPESRELYRDPESGFLLLGHTEPAGLYRPPHDHGRGWVLYAVERGEEQMSTYRRVHDRQGRAVLVKRETFVLGPGDTRVFLPGDIHDTLCKAGPLTLLRFTSRDFQREEIIRYPEPTGAR